MYEPPPPVTLNRAGVLCLGHRLVIYAGLSVLKDLRPERCLRIQQELIIDGMALIRPLAECDV
jgi:hypothetical protein